MQNIFPRIHAFVARWEGGFADHKNDPGKATKYGVSLRWLQSIGYDVNGDGRVDILDIHALTPDLALALFYQYFWDEPKLEALPPLVAALIYDGGVNMGTPRAVKQLQRVCNRVQGPMLKTDGICGPVTAARVNALCVSVYSQLTLCRNVLNAREEYYRQLAAREPFRNKDGRMVDYRPFLGGWLNRTAALWQWLQNEAGQQ